VEQRQLLLTGLAPRGPEVDEHDLATQRRELERGAGERGALEIGGLAGPDLGARGGREREDEAERMAHDSSPRSKEQARFQRALSSGPTRCTIVAQRVPARTRRAICRRG